MTKERIKEALQSKDYVMELFNTMVRQVNEAEVAPNERLSDRAYIIDVRSELKCVV